MTPEPTPAERPLGPAAWRRTALGVAAGIAVAVAAMAALGVSKGDLVRELRPASWWPLAAAAAGSLVLLGLQSLRWWLVMRPVAPLRFRDAYAAMAVGFFFNAFLPARGGDLLRAQYLGRRTGVSRAKLLGTEIVDACSDKWGWLVAFPAVALAGSPPPWLLRAMGILAGALVVAGLFLALMGSRLGRGGRPGSRAPAWLDNLRDGFAARRWKSLLAVQTLVAPLPWLWETLLIAIAGRALGLALSPMEAFATLTAFNVAIAVPLPANMGSFEGGGTVALIQFQVARPAALAFMFLYHLTQLVPGVALGGALVALHGRSMLGWRSRAAEPPPAAIVPDDAGSPGPT